MNTDDRDIVCQQDYTPLSNAELVEAIERYAAIMHTAPLIDFDLEWITGPARALLARAEAAEEALDALKAGDAVGATITQFLGARPDLKITMTAVPWGENGLLEAPVILATIGDYLGHTFYTDYTERSTTVEVALRALSAQITQSVEATEDKHHE